MLKKAKLNDLISRSVKKDCVAESLEIGLHPVYVTVGSP